MRASQGVSNRLWKRLPKLRDQKPLKERRKNMFTNQISKSTTRIAFVIAAAILLSVGFALFRSGSTVRASTSADDCDQQCLQDLAAARAATAKYQQESVALSDGFFADAECVEAPGLGGMGIHYANQSRTNDLNVD